MKFPGWFSCTDCTYGNGIISPWCAIEPSCCSMNICSADCCMKALFKKKDGTYCAGSGYSGTAGSSRSMGGFG